MIDLDDDAAQLDLFGNEPAPTIKRDYRRDVGLTIQQQFELFHEANPWVYEALRRLALDLVRRGRGRIGVKMLFEVLRWHYWRSTLDATSDFKLNNNYHSRYARMLMAHEPLLADAFETRELKAA